MHGDRGDSTLRDRGVARRSGEGSVGSVRAGEDHSLGLDMATWHQSNTWRCGRGSQKRAAVRREAAAGDGHAGVRRDSVKIRDWTRSPRKGAQILQEAKTHFPTLRSQSDYKSPETCPTWWPGPQRPATREAHTDPSSSPTAGATAVAGGGGRAEGPPQQSHPGLERPGGSRAAPPLTPPRGGSGGTESLPEVRPPSHLSASSHPQGAMGWRGSTNYQLELCKGIVSTSEDVRICKNKDIHMF